MTAGRLARIFSRVVVLPLAAVCAIAMRLLAPIRTVRIGRVRSERIGHLALEPELYLCRRDVVGAPTIDLFWFSRPVCNDQLVTMWKRVLRSGPLVEQVDRVSRSLPGRQRHIVPWVAEDHEGWLHRLPAHLTLSAEERVRGAAERLVLGVDEASEHVCFIARDAAYLATTLPQYDASAHDYRDADIQTYAPMAEEIARRGHAAVRMGAVVGRPFVSDAPGIIDYATGGRSEFMDVYLFATCRFAICSSSGPSTLALIFRRPLGLANVAPLLTVARPPVGQVFIPKTYRSAATGDPLTATEIRHAGAENLGETSEFEARGVVLEPNSPEELVDLAIEMDERVAGTWQPDAADDERQELFWSQWDRLPAHRDAPLRIGAAYLRDHPELLE